MDKITEAERKIAAILSDLEVDLNSIVEDISIHEIDVTTCDGPRDVLKHIAITMSRKPGTRWTK